MNKRRMNTGLAILVIAIVLISMIAATAAASNWQQFQKDKTNNNLTVQTTVQEVLFDGTVTLTNGSTFAFVPSNNASASYTVNSTTDLGALTATGLPFNASDKWYASYGSFYINSIEGIENEAWPNNTWAIYINDVPAPKGLGGNELEDGDNVKFYFCPANATTYAYITEDASYLLNITVNTIPDILFDGTVTLTNGSTFAFVPSNNASASYTVNSTTDLGALTATGLPFNASDKWYASYGSFYINSIEGIENEAWPNNTWAIYINDVPAPKGLGGNELEDGDNVKFYFCPANATTYAYITEDASYLLNITVSVTLRKGDANHDGSITAADASMVLQMAVGSIPPNDEADMNCDGRVTSLDALMILQTTA